MKKLFILLFVASAMSIMSCGPSNEEKAKMEAEAKAKMDSLFNAASQSMDATMDSTKATDSTATKTE